jgi:predicted RND superfamily exporter protein
MFATHGTVQGVENARVALVLIAVGIVVFWRTVLRALLAIIAVAVVVAVAAGALVLLQGIH